jgi:hypothetical protein
MVSQSSKEPIADRLIREAYERIRVAYPSGCFDWAHANRPDIPKAINEAVDDIEKAYGNKDLQAYRNSVEKWEKLHMFMIHKFKEAQK